MSVSVAACSGADYVFHTASPFFNDPKDAQKELVEPAVHGTSNVLHSVAKNRRAHSHCTHDHADFPHVCFLNTVLLSTSAARLQVQISSCS